jgi:hypothetical protein
MAIFVGSFLSPLETGKLIDPSAALLMTKKARRVLWNTTALVAGHAR